MNSRIWFTALVSLGLVNCAHFVPPDPADSVGKPIPIVAPVLNENLGALFLMSDGLWAWRPEQSKKDRVRLEPGQVTIFGDLDEKTRHVFAVMSVQDWGAVLQRLDADSIGSRTSGSLVPLSSLEPATAKRWNFCAGFAERPEESACIDGAAAGTVWHVYALNGSNSLSPVKDAPELVLPFRRHAVARTGGGSTFGDISSDAFGWIAIPDGITHRPAAPRVLVDSDCPDLSLNGLDLVRADTKAEHPLTATNDALEHGIDALVVCEGDEARVSIPALHRLPLPGSDTRLNIPSMLTVGPVRLAASSSALASVITGAAFLGAGDVHAADYYFEHALYLGDSGEAALRSMDVAAASGRPEAAMRRGQSATSSAWNRDANPFWNLGLARVEHELGMVGDFNARISKIPSIANSANEPDLSAWLAWIELRRKLEAGAPSKSIALDELLDKTSDPRFEAWRVLYKVEVLRREGKDALDHIRSDMNAIGATTLADAYMGELPPLPCADDACKLDAYGRRWNARLERTKGLVDAVERMPRATWRPGVQITEQTGAAIREVPAGDRLRFWAAVAVITGGDSPPVQQGFVDAAVDAAGMCEGRMGDDLAGSIRALSATLAADAEDDDDLASLAWLGSSGLEAACRGVETLSTLAATHRSRSGALDAPGFLFDALLERADTPEKVRGTLIAAAEYGKRSGGERCRRWNLALAVAAAQAGRIEPARQLASDAAECAHVAFSESESVVLAFLGFEKTRHVSNDFSKPVRATLGRVLHQVPQTACVGTEPIEYDLLAAVDGEVAALATRLALEPRPIKDLDLVKASDSLTRARNSLDDTRSALREKRTADAWKSLNDAHEEFRKLYNLPGLARTQYLMESLFALEPGATYDAKMDARRQPREPRWLLRHGETPVEVPPSLSLAKAWLERGDGAFSDAGSIPDEARNGRFCTPRVETSNPAQDGAISID